MNLFEKAKSLGEKTVEETKKYAEITKLNMLIIRQSSQGSNPCSPV